MSIHKFVDGYRGELWRKSQLNGAWKKRYFVLDKKKLQCFENSNCDKLISEMVLFNDVSLYDMPGSSEERGNLMYFTASVDDVYFLSADTTQIKRDWLEALSDAQHNGFKLMNQKSLGIEPFYPTIDLALTYQNETFHANNSNRLKPSGLQEAPLVTLNHGHEHNIYSLVMIDLDTLPMEQQETDYFYLHWAIVNIEGTDVTTGLELSHYEPPSPEYNSGLHRYMFLLFDQSSDFTPEQFDELDEMFAHRDKFSHIEFMKKFHLAAPVGLNGFYSSWDETCDDMHAAIGYVPLSHYMSPKQAAQAAHDRAERSRQGLFKDFVLSDVYPAEEVDPTGSVRGGTIVLEILYDGEYECQDGEHIPPQHTAREPEVSYAPHPIEMDAKGKPECGMYTLLLIDPDAPSRIHPDMREQVNWVVSNIPQDKVTEGEYVLSYQTPAPAFSSGLHRCIFSLFKQKRAFSQQELQNQREFFAPRSGLHTYEWVKSQSDVLHNVPVGVEAFLSEWDPTVDAVHKAIGYLPPSQYLSPSQKRAQLSQSAGKSAFSLFSPRAGVGETDTMEDRLKEIQKAHDAFNSKISMSSFEVESSSSKQNKEIMSGSSAVENGSEGSHSKSQSMTMSLESSDNLPVPPPVASAASKKVAPRKPITMGNAKNLTSSGLPATMTISIPGETDTDVIAASLLSSADDNVMEQQTTRQEESKSATATSQRAHHTTEETINEKSSTDMRAEGSDGRIHEGRSETVSEKRRESRMEESTETYSEHSSAKLETSQVNMNMHSANTSELLQQEQVRMDSSRAQQQQNLQSKHAELMENQQIAYENITASRQQEQEERLLAQAEQQRAEQERIQAMRIQQEKEIQESVQKAERQRAEEERLKEVQRQNQGQPKYRGPRKQRSEQEFFSALPDSEYSDTDQSAYNTDNASVLSGPPAPSSLYGNLQQSYSGSSVGLAGPNASGGIGINSGNLQSESEESDLTSSARRRRNRDDAVPGAAKRGAAKPVVGDAITRSKQLHDRVVAAKSTSQMCDLFGVKTQTIFTGEKMKKKLSNDYLSKDSFLWISPRTRSLHWSKTAGDAEDSKFLALDTQASLDPNCVPKGEMKGVVKRLRVSGPNLLITMESGEFLELKLSSDGNPPPNKRAADWATVIKAFSPTA